MAKARTSLALCCIPGSRGPCFLDFEKTGGICTPAALDVCADQVVARTWLRLLVAEELPGESLFFHLPSEKFRANSTLACSAGWTCAGLLACTAAEINPPAHLQTRGRGL